MMEAIRITTANADQKIRQLYETAFPEDEQIPWDDLMRLVGEMPLDFTAYYDGEVKEQREQSQACLNSAESRENSTEGQAFIGFTIVYPRKSFKWFCTLPCVRNYEAKAMASRY